MSSRFFVFFFLPLTFHFTKTVLVAAFLLIRIALTDSDSAWELGWGHLGWVGLELIGLGMVAPGRLVTVISFQGGVGCLW